MQYMLMFFESEKELAKREDPAQAEAYWGAWNAYIGGLAQSGCIVNGDGLHPPRTATRVSVQAGKRHVQDGPVPDAKEHLGGYFVIEAKDLDAALDWAAKAPNVGDGYTEVRPVLPPPKS
jgi:hypothetical protein